jgi:hypothetical protein
MTIQHAHITWTATSLGADHAATIVQRYHEAIPYRFPVAGWFDIAHILTEATAEFDDHEARRGVTESYRVLVEDVDGVRSVPVAADDITLTPGDELLFTSNTDPTIDQEVLAVLPLEVGLPSLSLVASAAGRYGQRLHQSTDNLGETISLNLERYGTDDVVNAGPNLWRSLVALFRRIDLPYICVLDPFGSRWLARMDASAASMPFFLVATLGVPLVEDTDTPSVVVVS